MNSAVLSWHSVGLNQKFNPNWDVIVIDNEFTIHFVSDHFLKLVKYKRDEIVGRRLHDFSARIIPPQSLLFANENFHQVNIDFKTAIGDHLHFLCSGFLQEVDEQIYAVLFYNDITQYSLSEKRYFSKEIEYNHLLYKLSHDVRGPIATAKGLLEILSFEEPSTSGHLKRYVELMKETLHNLDRKVKSLGENSDNNDPHGLFTYTDIDIQKTVYNTINNLSKYYNIFDVIFDFELQKDSKIRSYEAVLSLVFTHLIIFSLESKDKDKKLVLKFSARQDTNSFYIFFKDNAIGLPEEEIYSVLSSGFKANISRNMALLSLFTLKKSLDFLNADFKVNSNLNEGTEFHIYLPVF